MVYGLGGVSFKFLAQSNKISIGWFFCAQRYRSGGKFIGNKLDDDPKGYRGTPCSGVVR